MNNEQNKMPKWKDMVAYEKALLIIQIALVAVDLGVSIFYKFQIPGVSQILIGVIFVLGGFIYLRTNKKMAALWFILGLVNAIFSIEYFLP
ncbi:MAG: hypothetical protein SO401_05620 [Blautia sp.]|nr:hypothetical protein [Clostridia bacterium]MDY4693026.1 hypothetical protein [Blautia sp.]MDY5555763.1 hypothetical protein [Blautia sp.]